MLLLVSTIANAVATRVGTVATVMPIPKAMQRARPKKGYIGRREEGEWDEEEGEEGGEG